ncbi:MAG: hypothetical protein TUN42_10915 [Dehalogenimonas sp.]
MKLTTQKTYCPLCKSLVKGIKEQDGNRMTLLCPQRKRVLWNYDGYSWFPSKKGT